MRSVPSRPRMNPESWSSYGFTPVDGDLETRIATLKNLSSLAQATGDAPLEVGWESGVKAPGVQSYADAIWASVRVLQDAAKVQVAQLGYTGFFPSQAPENAGPYNDAIKSILDTFNPASPNAPSAFAFSATDPARGQAGPGWVTWKPIGFLDGLLNGVSWAPKGTADATLMDKAKKSKDALLNRIASLRVQARPGSTAAPGTEWRALTVNESLPAAIERWKTEGPAPAGAGAPGAGPADPNAPGAEPADPNALPTWAVPVGVGIAVIVGIGLISRANAMQELSARDNRTYLTRTP